MEDRVCYAPQYLHKVEQMQAQLDRPSVPCRPTGAPHSKSWSDLRGETRRTKREDSGLGERGVGEPNARAIGEIYVLEGHTRQTVEGRCQLTRAQSSFHTQASWSEKVVLDQSQGRVAKEFLSSTCVVCPICHILLELLRIFATSARLAGVTILPMSLLSGLYFCDTGLELQITVSCIVRRVNP